MDLTKAMKPWLNEHGAIVDVADVAPSPSKDFFHIFMTPTQVVYRLWKIVPPHRADSHTPPIEVRDTIEDFLSDERLHSEISRTAGYRMVEYMISLCNGNVDCLARLEDKILLKIITMLDLEDILRLGRVNKRFKELCDGDELWERIYRTNSEVPISPELMGLAASAGWKRLFFTNKLQLQVQLRRSRQRQH